MDQKGSAAMLISIQSAGVTPEVNLRITQARKHTRDPLGFEIRSPKQGYQWPHKKDLCPPKTFLKKTSQNMGFERDC